MSKNKKARKAARAKAASAASASTATPNTDDSAKTEEAPRVSRLRRVGRSIKSAAKRVARIFVRSAKATGRATRAAYRAAAKAAHSVMSALKAAFSAFIRALKAGARWTSATATVVGGAAKKAAKSVYSHISRAVKATGRAIKVVAIAFYVHVLGNLLWGLKAVVDFLRYRVARGVKKVVVSSARAMKNGMRRLPWGTVGRVLWISALVVLIVGLVALAAACFAEGGVLLGIFLLVDALWVYSILKWTISTQRVSDFYREEYPRSASSIHDDLWEDAASAAAAGL